MRTLRDSKRILLLLVATVTFQGATPPADVVSGIWHWETDGGERQITMTLKADAGKLNGTVSMGQQIVKAPQPPPQKVV